jgi:putative addiction module component (TIGR02574 family)
MSSMQSMVKKQQLRLGLTPEPKNRKASWKLTPPSIHGIREIHRDSKRRARPFSSQTPSHHLPRFNPPAHNPIDAGNLFRNHVGKMTTLSDPTTLSVLSLPRKDRAALAQALIQSLEERLDEGVEAAWQKEINKRLDALEAGQSSCRDAFASLDEMEARLREPR